MLNPSDTIIALDFGAKRIGLAVASVAARLPSPLGTLGQSPTLFEDIRVLTGTHKAIAFVVGLPRNLNGGETAQTAEARHFAQELGSRLKLPVYLQDEAVTSKKAETELRNRGIRYNKGDVDALAAVYILEDFLREHPEISL